MPPVHTTVALTDQLRTASENLLQLDDEQILASDDPLTVVRNLAATVDAIATVWPSIAERAGFEGGDEAAAGISKDVHTSLRTAAEALTTAGNNI